jgi:hypothetical protein
MKNGARFRPGADRDTTSENTAMQTLRFSTIINADKQQVWDTMLSDTTYREWTKAFHEGSYYEGRWEKGSEIRFLALNDKGEEEGMLSRIKECEKYSFVSIEHLGMISKGSVDTTSEEVKKWAHALENYTLTEKDNQTTLVVETQVDDAYISMFEQMWPQALQSLKQLCER